MHTPTPCLWMGANRDGRECKGGTGGNGRSVTNVQLLKCSSQNIPLPQDPLLVPFRTLNFPSRVILLTSSTTITLPLL